MRDRCSTAELHSDCLFRDTYLIIFKKYSFLKVGFFLITGTCVSMGCVMSMCRQTLDPVEQELWADVGARNQTWKSSTRY